MTLSSLCNTLLSSLLLTSLPAMATDNSSVRDTFVNDDGRTGPQLVELPGGRYELAGKTGFSVVLSPFAMAINDTTNTEYVQFLNEHGSQDGSGINFLVEPEAAATDIVKKDGLYRVAAGRDIFPVTGVSWQGALAYAQWLSNKTGQFYFLPTETQWEYAARAGSNTHWPWGDTFNGHLANCGSANTTAKVTPAGNYLPNAWGLHDMVGNVWQWTADCFPHDLEALGAQDPSGFMRACLTPSIRGGGAANAIEQCQPGFRANYWWRGLLGHIGFRVVRLNKGASER